MANNYFIHFGCWNNGGCPKENDLTKVLTNIKKIKADNEIKEKKKKYFIYENLLTGFECLPKDIKIYMTYGNHDFETELYIDENVKETDCTLTKTEISIVENKFSNISLKLFQSIQFNKNTLILFIDTTIYDYEDINEYIKCYKLIDSIYKNVKIVKNKQIEFIDLFVSSVKNNNEINNIIIIGHHPLAQFKIKKENMRYLYLNTELNNMLYDRIYNELNKDMNYYYLCADLHQYQSGNITINNNMKIKQYIVGTAGAKKDEIRKDLLFTSPQIIENIEYYMDENDINNSTNENGYLTCISNETNIIFNFIQINTFGGKQKTKNKKQKTKNKKTKKTKNKKTKKNKKK